jgi:hypothetical protein
MIRFSRKAVEESTNTSAYRMSLIFATDNKDLFIKRIQWYRPYNVEDGAA